MMGRGKAAALLVVLILAAFALIAPTKFPAGNVWWNAGSAWVEAALDDHETRITAVEAGVWQWGSITVWDGTIGASSFAYCPELIGQTPYLFGNNNSATQCFVPAPYKLYITELCYDVTSNLSAGTEECQVQVRYNEDKGDASPDTTLAKSGGAYGALILGDLEGAVPRGNYSQANTDGCVDMDITTAINGFWYFAFGSIGGADANNPCVADDDPWVCCDGAGTGTCTSTCSDLKTVNVRYRFKYVLD